MVGLKYNPTVKQKRKGVLSMKTYIGKVETLQDKDFNIWKVEFETENASKSRVKIQVESFASYWQAKGVNVRTTFGEVCIL